MHAEPVPPLMTIADVADRLGVSVRHVRRLVHERRIPYLKWGQLLRFDPVDTEDWLDRVRVSDRDAATPLLSGGTADRGAR